MKTPALLTLTFLVFSYSGLFGNADCNTEVSKSCCKGPSVVKSTTPVLPENFLAKGETAEVIVRCAINEKGELVGAKTIKSTHKDLEKIVVAAIENWEFDASTHMGKPQRATLNIPFKFTLAAK